MGSLTFVGMIFFSEIECPDRRNGSWWVYILQSDDGALYIGQHSTSMSGCESIISVWAASTRTITAACA